MFLRKCPAPVFQWINFSVFMQVSQHTRCHWDVRVRPWHDAIFGWDSHKKCVHRVLEQSGDMAVQKLGKFIPKNYFSKVFDRTVNVWKVMQWSNNSDFDMICFQDSVKRLKYIAVLYSSCERFQYNLLPFPFWTLNWLVQCHTRAMNGKNFSTSVWGRELNVASNTELHSLPECPHSLLPCHLSQINLLERTINEKPSSSNLWLINT